MFTIPSLMVPVVKPASLLIAERDSAATDGFPQSEKHPWHTIRISFSRRFSGAAVLMPQRVRQLPCCGGVFHTEARASGLFGIDRAPTCYQRMHRN